MDKKVGDKPTYSLLNGRTTTVEIVDAVPWAGVRLDCGDAAG